MLSWGKVGAVLGLSTIAAGMASAPVGSAKPDSAQSAVHHQHQQIAGQCHGAGCACPVCMALVAKAQRAAASSATPSPDMGYVAAIAATSTTGIGLLGYSMASMRNRPKRVAS